MSPVASLRLLASCFLTSVVTVVAAEPPALVVVVAIDQFRADYLTRFRPFFGPGGFNRLLEKGAEFSNCTYAHSVTKTACGHAVMLTGVHADRNGIIGNDWIDRDTLQRVNCVQDESVEALGADDKGTPVRMPGARAKRGVSPRRLLTSTVGDELKLATGGRAKVIGISSKDRSAVLLAGRLGDAAYWMDKGGMVSSTYYQKQLPEWVQAFNAAGRPESYFGKTWDRVLPREDYDRLQGPDDAAGEGADWGLGTTFPRVLNGGQGSLGPAYYEAFESSPYKNEVLADFARAVIVHEKLGQRGVTDVLGLSFSTNDTIGHSYGPHSHEVMDITVRTDRVLAELLTYLDQRIGLHRCTIILTADHGAAPLPERIQALQGDADAGRIDNARLLRTCEAALDQAFGPLENNRRWLVSDAGAVLFQRGVLEDKKLDAAAAEAVVRDALRTVDFVQEAFTRTDLLAGRASGEFGAAMLLSFHPERSGDVLYQLRPYWVDRKTGTNHGTPYTYDTHVPLLWYGAGVKPGVYLERASVADIAPTLARILGLPAPPMARGRVLF